MPDEYLTINIFGLVEGTAHGTIAIGALTIIAVVGACVFRRMRQV